MDTRAYEIRIWYSPEPGDECFIAQVVEMPTLSAHGATREEAAREIGVVLKLACEVAAELGDKLPAPSRKRPQPRGHVTDTTSRRTPKRSRP